MTSPIDIRADHLRIVQDVLQQYLPGNVKVWVFGSRASWTTKDSSDLDLALEGETCVLPRTLSSLEAAFEESDLPFAVDIVDVSRIGERFRQMVAEQRVPLPLTGSRNISGRRTGSGDEDSGIDITVSSYLDAADGWIYCTLADACSSIDYGLTASASRDSSGPRFLRITDIVSGHLDWNNVPYAKVDNATAKKYELHNGDIVIARTGASTGASMYTKEPPPAVFASYLVRLQAKSEFDSRFLAYYLKSPLFWQFIRGVLGDKSAQPNASASTMSAAPLHAPKDKSEQRAIAHILGTLDDKIELNRRMNDTLEAMARALFKSWFVDFDPVRAKMEGRDHGLPKHIADLFPDRFVDSELGEIPEGWAVKALGDLFELAYGKALKANSRHRGNVPVYGSNGKVGWHDKKLVQGPGIVVGRKGNPGVVTWVATDFFPIDTTFYVVPKDSNLNLYFLFYALKGQDLPSIAADSAVPGLNRHLACMNKQVMPAGQIVEHFDGYIGPIFDRSYRLEAESHTLAALRDALLPKLISGELRVKDAGMFFAGPS